MQIILHEQPRSTLEEFADKHGLVMEITERKPGQTITDWSSSLLYFAHFSSCEIKEGDCLRGAFGSGATPKQAMANYAREISGRRVVLNAFSETRREIEVPLLTNS